MSQRRPTAKASTDGIMVAGASAHPHEVRSPLSLDSILSNNNNSDDDHENGNDMDDNPGDHHLLLGIGNDEIVSLAEHDPERSILNLWAWLDQDILSLQQTVNRIDLNSCLLTLTLV